MEELSIRVGRQSVRTFLRLLARLALLVVFPIAGSCIAIPFCWSYAVNACSQHTTSRVRKAVNGIARLKFWYKGRGAHCGIMCTCNNGNAYIPYDLLPLTQCTCLLPGTSAPKFLSMSLCRRCLCAITTSKGRAIRGKRFSKTRLGFKIPTETC